MIGFHCFLNGYFSLISGLALQQMLITQISCLQSLPHWETLPFCSKDLDLHLNIQGTFEVLQKSETHPKLIALPVTTPQIPKQKASDSFVWYSTDPPPWRLIIMFILTAKADLKINKRMKLKFCVKLQYKWPEQKK